MYKPKVLIFASGTKTGGGSGAENLVNASRSGEYNFEVVGIVSNHLDGGVSQKARRLDVPFYWMAPPWDEVGYRKLVRLSNADFFALSGWLKLVKGLDPDTKFNSRTVFNIHPGPLPRFGGRGMYGHKVHEAVMAAYKNKEIFSSAVTMHFVTKEYDKGLKFLEVEVPIRPDDTVDSLAKRVNEYEHVYQPRVTNLVVNGHIKWDGENKHSLIHKPLYRPRIIAGNTLFGEIHDIPQVEFV